MAIRSRRQEIAAWICFEQFAFLARARGTTPEAIMLAQEFLDRMLEYYMMPAIKVEVAELPSNVVQIYTYQRGRENGKAL